MKPRVARLITSSANGAESRSPKTPEGKRRSSMNALDHGLTAQSLLLPGESPNRHHDLAPQTDAEKILAQRVSAAAWRLLRADAFETALVEEQLADTPARPHRRHRSLQAFNDHTLLRGQGKQAGLAEENQEFSDEKNNWTNEPSLENAPPESGDRAA